MEQEPRRPVASELEEVVEVCEAECLEIGDHVLERLLFVDRSERDQVALHPELVRGESQPLIESGAAQTAALIRVAPNEERGRSI